jgi:D-serine deaminase-like pyridoxal phosphate-dependent protein
MSSQYITYKEAIATLPCPVLFLDLESLDKNIEWVAQNSGNKKIRIATKSIRSIELLKRIHDSHPVFKGYMTYSLQEALWLRSEGLKDILMGYPTMDREGLEVLAKNPEEITLMVDRVEHLDLLEQIARSSACNFRLCIDMDLSMDLPGIRFGVYRSHLQNQKQLKTFLTHLKKCPHLKVVGLMGYEAQIAGVIDEKSTLIKTLKKLSLKQLIQRRETFLNILKKNGHEIEMINGGGTGSLKHTALESIVTEVTVGSAFYAPVLFDHYQDFKLTPALFFSLPVVRHPTKDILTVLGGGYIASGATDAIKQPQPYLPQGLSLLKHEGAGEVQTPLKYDGRKKIKIGDPIIFRHAKAAEICERFNEIYLIEDGKMMSKVTTYRGEGKCFL